MGLFEDFMSPQSQGLFGLGTHLLAAAQAQPNKYARGQMIPQALMAGSQAAQGAQQMQAQQQLNELRRRALEQQITEAETAQERERRVRASLFGPYAPEAGGKPWTNPDTGQTTTGGGLLDGFEDPEKRRVMGLFADYDPGKAIDLLANPPEAKPPTIQQFNVGGEQVSKQWNPTTGQWEEVSRAPRWQPQKPDRPRVFEVNGRLVDENGREVYASPDAGKSNITPTMERENQEIAAARKYLRDQGWDADELKRRMTDADPRTGLPSENYDPRIRSIVSKATQRMTGADPDFEQFYRQIYGAPPSAVPRQGGGFGGAVSVPSLMTAQGMGNGLMGGYQGAPSMGVPGSSPGNPAPTAQPRQTPPGGPLPEGQNVRPDPMTPGAPGGPAFNPMASPNLGGARGAPDVLPRQPGPDGTPHPVVRSAAEYQMIPPGTVYFDANRGGFFTKQ